jgi:Mn2+/Fe2+ NRAMP family transporter
MREERAFGLAARVRRRHDRRFMAMAETETEIEENPYLVKEDTIQEPPTTFFGKCRYLGPGFILSASIVGSGELIATTTLGAKAGFVALWVILVSCLVKVALQLEFGKHAISSGEPTFQSFNKLPGLKIGKAHWTVWTWLLLMVFKFLQVGAIVGLVAVILRLCFPMLSETVWTLVVAGSVALIVFNGIYKVLEKLSLVAIGAFTVFTLFSLVALQSTDQAFSVADVLSGLTFDIPPGMLFVVIGAFGITGVGGDEIMAYNYWLIEKGYASKTGPRKDTVEWERRAKGWISVMYADAVAAMIVYTVVTAAFYMLGAAILHGAGDVPTEGEAFIGHLAALYTTTLGEWAKPAFYLGAFIVLFSTAFSALGAWTRQFSDAFGRVGWIDFENAASRRKCIGILAWVIPFLWAFVWIVINPMLGGAAAMVLIGGFVTSIILLIVLYAAIYFKLKATDPRLRSGTVYNILFWISAVAIFCVGVYTVLDKFGIFQK